MNYFLKVCLVLSLFISGCATVHMFGASNPDVPLKTYKNILIIANVPGMEFQRQLEDGLTEKLSKDPDQPHHPGWSEDSGSIRKPSAKFFQRSHMIFQISPLTTKNIQDLCEKSGCDGVFFIAVNPPTTKDYNINLGSTTKGSVTPSTFGSYNFTSVTTENSISGTITTFTATVDLVDIETGKIAWHSEETVSTGMFASWDQAIDSFLQTVTDTIEGNNILLR